MSEVFGTDAYSPKEIAERIENVGVTKARLPLLSTFALGVLAGGFISLGANFFTIVASDGTFSFGVVRVLGGLVFSMGLGLVLIAGAELFTGNNLLVMACVSRKITVGELLKNWAVVFFANFAGAVGLALLVYWSQQAALNNQNVGATMVKIASQKANLPFFTAFFRGVLCNLLVCLAVWCAAAGRTVVDKTAAILLPITAFVAGGFEHSIANMYFLTVGYLHSDLTPVGVNAVTLADFAVNLIPVTLGNILGGSGMVALIYWIIYRRSQLPRATL